MALATVAGMFMNKIDPKDFMILASAAFSFYFANKGTQKDDFLGK